MFYLEDSKQRNRKRIEVSGWRSLFEIKLASKELHSKEREDKNKEKQQEQQ